MGEQQMPWGWSWPWLGSAARGGRSSTLSWPAGVWEWAAKCEIEQSGDTWGRVLASPRARWGEHRHSRPSPRLGTNCCNLLLAFCSSAAWPASANWCQPGDCFCGGGTGRGEPYGAWATMASILAVGALADAGVRTEIIRRVGAAKGEGESEARRFGESVRQGVTMFVVLAGGATPAPGSLAAPGVYVPSPLPRATRLQRVRGRPGWCRRRSRPWPLLLAANGSTLPRPVASSGANASKRRV